jgi:Uma2 family endonuclease
MIQALAATPEATSDADVLYEVVDGEKVVKRMSTYENVLAGVLFAHLHGHAVTNGLGRATIEVMFDLPNLPNDRRPDVAFVSYSRWPLDRRPPAVDAWPVVPELAAEVVSPTDDMTDVMEKVEDYFRSGVSVVWLVLPQQERVYVYTTPTAVRVLSRTDELTGNPAIPGFRLPLAELFPPPDAPTGGAGE